MTEGTKVCDRSFRAEERWDKLSEKTTSRSLPRHELEDSKSPDPQFQYSQLGRAVVKRHTYLTTITQATYPWNYAHPGSRKSAFRMPRTIYPKK